MPSIVGMESFNITLESEKSSYQPKDYSTSCNIPLNISECQDTNNIGLTDLSHSIDESVGLLEESVHKYETLKFENKCNIRNQLTDKYFMPSVIIFDDVDKKGSEEDIDNKRNIVHERCTEFTTNDKQIKYEAPCIDKVENMSLSSNITTLNINVSESDYFNLKPNINELSDLKASSDTDGEDDNKVEKSYFQLSITDDSIEVVRFAGSIVKESSNIVPNIIGESVVENGDGKSTDKKVAIKNVSCENIHESELEIDGLGESFAKLNVDREKVGVVSVLTDSLQHWNIRSDLAHSSDDEDDDNCEEQDVAFEGDDENDDNDEDVDYEQPLPPLVLPLELTSKSPVPRVQYSQKFHPYHKQDNQDLLPNFELIPEHIFNIDNIEYSDADKQFFSSIPLDLHTYAQIADKVLQDLDSRHFTYNKRTREYVVDVDEGNGSPSQSSEYNITNSPLTDDDFQYIPGEKIVCAKSSSITSDLAPSPLRCDISSPECSASDTENTVHTSRTGHNSHHNSSRNKLPGFGDRYYLMNPIGHRTSITGSPHNLGHLSNRMNKGGGYFNTCPNKNNVLLSNKNENDKANEDAVCGHDAASSNVTIKNSLYPSNEGSVHGNVRSHLNQVPINDFSKSLCYVSNKENVTEFSKPSLQNGGRVIENKHLSGDRNLYIAPKKMVNFPPAEIASHQVCLPQPDLLWTEEKAVYRQPAIQPHGGLQLYESEMNKPGIPRLLQLCRSNERRVIEWIRVLVNKPGQKPDEESNLIQVLKEKPCPEVWPERMIAHISYIKKVLRNDNIFITPDKKQNSPLRLAAFEHNKEPLMVRCIADCIVEMGLNPENDIDANGESILHQLAHLGDSHVKVLAELLNVTIDGQPAFSVNRENIAKMTPLHVAIAKSSTNRNRSVSSGTAVGSLATVKLLIKHGAKLDAKDDKGCTPLHYALRDNYDMGILRELLQSPFSRSAINMHDDEGNTPLHMAAANNCYPFQKQKDAIKLLVNSGAKTRRNAPGYTQRPPLSLVSAERKEEIKKIIQKKS